MLQEIILKRAADLAEALYSMPRNANQLTVGAIAARSPPSMSVSGAPAGGVNGGVSTGFTTYSSQLPVPPPPPPDSISGTGQWDETWTHRYPAFTF